MRRLPRPTGRLTGLLLLSLLGCGCRENPVDYRVEPREVAAPAPAGSPHGGAGGPAATASPSGPALEWTAPAAWATRPPSEMRLASYAFTAADGAVADVSVFAFPDAAGGLLANINRWRRQVGLEPVADDAIESTATRTTIAGQEAWLVDFAGTPPADAPTMSGAPAPTGVTRTIGAIVPVGGRAWFFKMMGPDAVVASQRENFQGLVASIRTVAPASTNAPPPAVAAAAGAAMRDPHAGIPGAPPIGAAGADPHAGIPGAPQIGAAGGDPHAGVPGAPPMGGASMDPTAIAAPPAPPAGFTFEVPAGWENLGSTPFRLASFRIPGANVPAAEVTVTNFPGAVGGDFANVNRWRQQLGLAPLTESEFSAAVRRVTGQDQLEFVVTEFESAQPVLEGGHRARMLAAILKQPGSTWFFKMTGETGLVAGQRDAFERFLQSFHLDHDHAH